MICKICGKDCGNKGFNSHIKSIHNLKSKEYFDLYEKNSTDGFCKICGKETRFYGATRGYAKYCCNSHAQLDPETRNKYEQTCIEKYGAPNVYASEYGKQKIKETCQKHYNTDYALQAKEVKNRIKQTNLNKYGHENPQQNKEIKEKTIKTNIERYGNACAVHGEEQWKKAVETMKKNNHYSKLELRLEQFFKDNQINYISQYKCNLYPFYCDFYLLDFNVFIEINVYWHHNSHFFNIKNEKDLETVKIWTEKSKTNPQYKVALDVWTNRDVQKYKIAKANKLKYIVLWSKKDIEYFTQNFTNILLDWEFDEDQLLTYNNPVFVEQCKIRNKDFDALNTGWVKQRPLDEEEIEIADPEDDNEEDDDDIFNSDNDDLFLTKNDDSSKNTINSNELNNLFDDANDDKKDKESNEITDDTKLNSEDLKNIFDEDEEDEDDIFNDNNDDDNDIILSKPSIENIQDNELINNSTVTNDTTSNTTKIKLNINSPNKTKTKIKINLKPKE